MFKYYFRVHFVYFYNLFNLCGQCARPVYKTENTAVEIRHADHVTSSIRKRWY
jgi:hypothetical protein